MPLGAKGPSAYQIPDLVKKPVIWVFLLALLLRVVVCFSSHTINPDGKHYVYQAQAVYQMDFSAMTACRLNFVTIQPFLIALCFPLTGDWVAAGLTVSVIFSMASLLCIYLLSRRFFEENLSCLILLVYAMIPMFVKRSAEILRDPIFWFLATFGMLVFLHAVDRRKIWFDGFLSLMSCVVFILATSLRLEGVILIAGSGLYLLFCKHETKMRQILFYCLPFGLLCGLLVVAIFISDHDVVTLFKLNKFVKFATGLMARFDAIDQAVQVLISQSDGVERRFFRRLGEVFWIVPVGSIISR